MLSASAILLLKRSCRKIKIFYKCLKWQNWLPRFVLCIVVLIFASNEHQKFGWGLPLQILSAFEERFSANLSQVSSEFHVMNFFDKLKFLSLCQ